MMVHHILGAKGQIVIEKEIRDALGLAPGHLAVQTLVGDHVELRFFPPEHDESLLGVLAGQTRRPAPPDAWPRAVEEAWRRAVHEDAAGYGAEGEDRAGSGAGTAPAPGAEAMDPGRAAAPPDGERGPQATP
jgi:AbrB family looped-hinge helix DNA binding protein